MFGEIVEGADDAQIMFGDVAETAGEAGGGFGETAAIFGDWDGSAFGEATDKFGDRAPVAENSGDVADRLGESTLFPNRRSPDDADLSLRFRFLITLSVIIESKFPELAGRLSPTPTRARFTSFRTMEYSPGSISTISPSSSSRFRTPRVDSGLGGGAGAE
jgi:hypothetical protein